jgi:hypothetical protein
MFFFEKKREVPELDKISTMMLSSFMMPIVYLFIGAVKYFCLALLRCGPACAPAVKNDFGPIWACQLYKIWLLMN